MPKSRNLNTTCLILIVTVLAGCLTASCDKSVKSANPSEEGDTTNIIATVEKEPITLEAMQQEMRYRGGHIPDRFASVEARETLLNELIHFEVLAQKAKAAGYENDPEIRTALKKLMVKKYTQDFIEKQLDKQRIAETEVQQYYYDHHEEFITPEMYRPAIISLTFGSQDDLKMKTSKRLLAEKIRNQALTERSKSRDFGTLARSYSDDPRTKYRGGALNWLAKDAKLFQLDQTVLSALFDLKKPGDISPVVETKKGLYLVKLIDKKPAQSKSFNTVKDQIKRSLAAQKRKIWLEEYYQEAKQDFTITINKIRLEAIPIPTRFSISSSTPPSFPVN